MGFFDWLFKPSAESGPSALELKPAKQARLSSRTSHGTLIVDLRKATEQELAAGGAFALVKQEVAWLGSPSGMRLWMLPGATLDLWNRSEALAEIFHRFGDVGCHGSPDVTVLCGKHGDAPAVLQLLQSLGHQVFEVAADAAPPVVEVKLSSGKVVAVVNAPRLS